MVIKSESASEEERKEFAQLHKKKSLEILEKPLEEIFTMEPVHTALPAKAAMEASILCEECGEPTMKSKLVKKGDRNVCKDCLEKTVQMS